LKNLLILLLFVEEDRKRLQLCRLYSYPTTAGVYSVCRMKVRLGLLPEDIIEES